MLIRHKQPGRGGPCKFPNLPSTQDIWDLAGFGGETTLNNIISAIKMKLTLERDHSSGCAELGHGQLGGIAGLFSDVRN